MPGREASTYDPGVLSSPAAHTGAFNRSTVSRELALRLAAPAQARQPPTTRERREAGSGVTGFATAGLVYFFHGRRPWARVSFAHRACWPVRSRCFLPCDSNQGQEVEEVDEQTRPQGYARRGSLAGGVSRRLSPTIEARRRLNAQRPGAAGTGRSFIGPRDPRCDYLAQVHD